MSDRVIPRRAVASWILYDLANTIFSMGVVSLYFSLYVQDQVGADRADSIYGVITALSMGMLFIVSPALGAMTDRARRRMPFLVWSTIVCVTATAFIARGSFQVSVALFLVANFAYQAGVQFYDALLPEVSTAKNRGWVSGVGVGVGYIGSYIAVALGFVVPSDNRALLFALLAGCFLLIALPCFFFVQERGNPQPRPIFGWDVIRHSTRETIAALRSSTRFPGLTRFLVGRVFYTDAINTVISYMGLYTINVAMAGGLTEEGGENQARFVMLSAISFAIVGGFAWGWLVDRIGPRKTLNIVLWLWMATFALAAAVGAFTLPIIFLYMVGAMAGVALGGIWAADRPLMLRLSPADRVGEFYGLYGMVGRFATITGPLLWGAVVYAVVQMGGYAPLTGQAFAIVMLLAMVVVSYWILRTVHD